MNSNFILNRGDTFFFWKSPLLMLVWIYQNHYFLYLDLHRYKIHTKIDNFVSYILHMIYKYNSESFVSNLIIRPYKQLSSLLLKRYDKYKI